MPPAVPQQINAAICSPSNLPARQGARAAVKCAHSSAAAAAVRQRPDHQPVVGAPWRAARAPPSGAGRPAAGRNWPSSPPSAAQRLERRRAAEIDAEFVRAWGAVRGSADRLRSRDATGGKGTACAGYGIGCCAAGAAQLAGGAAVADRRRRGGRRRLGCGGCRRVAARSVAGGGGLALDRAGACLRACCSRLATRPSSRSRSAVKRAQLLVQASAFPIRLGAAAAAFAATARRLADGETIDAQALGCRSRSDSVNGSAASASGRRAAPGRTAPAARAKSKRALAWLAQIDFNSAPARPPWAPSSGESLKTLAESGNPAPCRGRRCPASAAFACGAPRLCGKARAAADR